MDHQQPLARMIDQQVLQELRKLLFGPTALKLR
jgi:hypothetical protein